MAVIYSQDFNTSFFNDGSSSQFYNLSCEDQISVFNSFCLTVTCMAGLISYLGCQIEFYTDCDYEAAWNVIAGANVLRSRINDIEGDVSTYLTDLSIATAGIGSLELRAGDINYTIQSLQNFTDYCIQQVEISKNDLNTSYEAFLADPFWCECSDDLVQAFLNALLCALNQSSYVYADYEDLGDVVTCLNDAIDSFNAILQCLNTAVCDYLDDVDNVNGTIQCILNDCADLKERANLLLANLATGCCNQAALAQSIQMASQSVGEIEDMANEIDEYLDDLSHDLDQVNQTVISTTADIQNISARLDEVKAQFNQCKADLKELNATLANLESTHRYTVCAVFGGRYCPLNNICHSPVYRAQSYTLAQTQCSEIRANIWSGASSNSVVTQCLISAASGEYFVDGGPDSSGFCPGQHIDSGEVVDNSSVNCTMNTRRNFYCAIPVA